MKLKATIAANGMERIGQDSAELVGGRTGIELIRNKRSIVEMDWQGSHRQGNEGDGGCAGGRMR